MIINIEIDNKIFVIYLYLHISNSLENQKRKSEISYRKKIINKSTDIINIIKYISKTHIDIVQVP